MLTYTINEGQLVKLFHGRPECAWAIPSPDAQINRRSLRIFTGGCFWDVLVLMDGRAILVAIAGAAHEEKMACIHPSLDHAYDGEGQERLSVV